MIQEARGYEDEAAINVPVGVCRVLKPLCTCCMLAPAAKSYHVIHMRLAALWLLERIERDMDKRLMRGVKRSSLTIMM